MVEKFPNLCYYCSELLNMANRGCVNFPDKFRYIYDEFMIKKYERNITDFVRKVYNVYFGVKMGDENKI